MLYYIVSANTMIESTAEVWPQKGLLASPRGFCAGVDRAIAIVKAVQTQNLDQPVYAYHEIIHNNHIIRMFEESGVSFVNSIEDIPEGALTVYSAHGVSPEIKRQAAQRKLRAVDAICPLVDKIHIEVERFLAAGMDILLIGHSEHDETVGTVGCAPQIKLIEKLEDVDLVEVTDPEKVALITQTTISMDDCAKIREAILKRFPNIQEPKKEDICFATQNRQNGVKVMIARGAEGIVVLGSPTSSNSTRLKEVAEGHGARAFFVDDVSQLNSRQFSGINCIGLTSGASAPEDKFREIVALFKANGTVFEEIVVAHENFQFALPKELKT